MAKQLEQPAGKGAFLPVILTLGGFFVFLVIVALVWMDRRPPTVALGGRTPQQRIEILEEQREQEREALTQYGWIDQEQGIVRLPVERAMDLVLEELNQEQNQN